MTKRKTAKNAPAADKAGFVSRPRQRVVKKAQPTDAALRADAERFRSLVQNIPGVAVQGFGVDGIITYWNQAAERLYGYTAPEALGHNLLDLIIPPEMRAGFMQAVRQMAETGQPVAASEHPRRCRDGSRVEVLSNHAVVSTPGHPAEFFCLDLDLTERKQAEAVVNESAEHYRSLFDASLDAILLTAPDGRILAANPAACRLLDRTEEEIQQIGRNGVMDTSDPRLVSAIAERARTGSFIGELTFLRKNGEKFPCELSTSVFKDKSGNLRTCMIVRDITERKRTMAALKESEEKFQKVYRDAPVWIAISDLADGTFLDVNEVMLRAFGFSSAEVLGRTAADLGWITAESRTRLLNEIQEHGRITDLEMTFRAKDGRQLHGLFNGEQIFLGGRPCLLTVTTDITVSKQTEAALRTSEERYQRITAAVTDYIYTVRVENGRAVKTTHGPGCLAVTGYQEEEFARDTMLWLHMVAVEDRPKVEEQARRILAGEDPPLLEHRLLHKNGSVRWVRNTCVPHRAENGTLIAYDGLIQDITERKLAEDALQKSEARYRSILNASPDDITITDLAGCILMVSPAAVSMFRYPKEATGVGMMLTDFLVPEDRALAVSRIGLKRQGIPTGPSEYRGLRADGSIFDIEVNSEFIRDADGQLTGMVFVVRDISERKQAEAALRESEASLRESQLIAGLGSFDIDLTTGRWSSSDVLDTLFGIDRTYERTVENWTALIHPEDSSLVKEYFANQFQGARPSFNKQYRIIRHDDQILCWVHSIGRVEFDPHGRPVKMRGTVQDVTKRKFAEEAIAALALRNQTLLQTASDGIHILDEQGNVVEANPAFCRMLGYTREEIFRLTVADWDAQWSRDELLSKIGALIVQPAVFETRHRRKDGTIRDVEINGVGVILEGRKYLYASARDITERKLAEAEKEKLAAQSQQLQKAESLGRMAGAIAHHFNNQLHAVMMRLEMAMNDLPREAEPAGNLTEAMYSARKAAEVSALMLTYLGHSFDKNAVLDLAEVCTGSLSVLRAVMPRNILLETHLPTPGPNIDANANQVQQVLTNLVTNAWEASGGGAESIRLTVKTVAATDLSSTAKYFPIDWQPQAMAYACLEVADAGCGIAAQDIEKVFDPFFSSKFTGRGLGLPVVLGIARSHHGAVTVESEPGKGSTFRVYWPVSAKARSL